MTPKQLNALQLVTYFIPEGDVVDFTLLGINDVTETPSGLTSEDAFFVKTQTGKTPTTTTDKLRLGKLLLGQRRMALHEKMYRQDFAKGRLFLEDFCDEPEVVKQFVQAILSQVKDHYTLAVMTKPV